MRRAGKASAVWRWLTCDIEVKVTFGVALFYNVPILPVLDIRVRVIPAKGDEQ